MGHIWFSSTITRLARLSRPRGAEIRQQPYIIRAGDGYKIRRYKRKVSITLVLVLNVTPLAIIHTVAYIYSKWLKVRCLIGWPRLSGYIQGTYSSSGICILRGGAVFLKNRAVVQSSRISALFTAYIGSLVSGTSSTIS